MILSKDEVMGLDVDIVHWTVSDDVGLIEANKLFLETRALVDSHEALRQDNEKLRGLLDKARVVVEALATYYDDRQTAHQSVCPADADTIDDLRQAIRAALLPAVAVEEAGDDDGQ